MKLNRLHQIWLLNSNHIGAGGTTGVLLLLSDTVHLRNPHDPTCKGCLSSRHFVVALVFPALRIP